MSQIVNVYLRYAQFTGRAGRPEFWYFALFYLVVAGVLAILDNALFGGSSIVGGAGWSMASGFQPLTSIFALVSLVPSLAVSVRRMHDLGKSGWWVTVVLIPFIGWIWLLILAAGAGETEANAFGEPV
jgi:uncharacterized membrane protein YhaH (DUF805 family)